MSQRTTGTREEQRAAREAGERGQRRLLQYLATGSTVGAFMMQSGPLFLLALGVGPFLIGLLATATSIGNTSRMIGVKLMPRFGKARLMGTARLASGFFLLLLVPLALHAGPGIAWAALGLLVLRQSMVQVGGSAWWPLVQDNTPKSGLASFITHHPHAHDPAALHPRRAPARRLVSRHAAGPQPFRPALRARPDSGGCQQPGSDAGPREAPAASAGKRSGSGSPRSCGSRRSAATAAVSASPASSRPRPCRSGWWR